ncbi:hypothetical protein GCM10028803_30330 [Larkinella knui]|uniref:Uncharacterized protein n=1 Tax=Larkinella knui TaxID=2025310 RepID=A0A3P1CXJ2_9BACT|nr:hypothetical protein [Larkinella knui]RRB18061.1 hypothetical protein EHT87_07250 [Larkinella knui]
MEPNTETKAAHFVAALEGIELTKEQHERISSGIQEVVMRELAHIDTQADIAIAKRFKFGSATIRPGDLINGVRLKLVQKGLFNG